MHRSANITTRVLVALLLSMGSASCFFAGKVEFAQCFGISSQDQLAVYLVEESVEEGGTYRVLAPRSRLPWDDIPSCGAFDGVEPGGRYTFSSIGLATKVSHGCSLPIADISAPDIGEILTARSQEAELTYTYRGSGLEEGVATVAASTMIDGCSGQWIFGTFIYGVGFKYSDRRNNSAWAMDYLFDQMDPGDDAPIVIIRHFKADAGSTCPALPEGVTECADIFSGYYERAL